MTYIPYGKQEITQQDIEAVQAVLSSDFITQGPQLPAFEKVVANYCQAQYSVAVNSATSALHIACLALEIGPGDIVWTSPNTFVASANCAIYCGATIDFIDIDPASYNISLDKLTEKLIQAEKDGRLPKAIIAVHFAGQSCPMQEIHHLSQRYGFQIIEDASHAIGGKYLDKPIGGNQFSDITVFSFHPVKIITTAEGGIATTNNPRLAEKMQLYRTHGITKDSKQSQLAPWSYQQIVLGYNYRMTDIQAALGISQMTRLDSYVSKRNQLAKNYDSLLEKYPLICPVISPDNYSARHLYPIQLKSTLIKKSRLDVFNFLRQSGIGVNVHYIPVHTQPFFQQFGFKQGDFPISEQYYQQAISLPLYPTMTQSQQEYITQQLGAALQL